MRELNLGFLETDHIAYDEGKKIEQTRPMTNYELAVDLEKRYDIVEFFFNNSQNYFVNAVSGDLIEEFNGDKKLSGLKEIEEKFVEFIKSKMMDGAYPGVPTGASIEGVNHLLPGNLGDPFRPSFIDTGQYVSAFRAWMK